MIKRAIILRSHGEKILLDSDKSAVRSLVLPEQKWTILKEIVVILQPFEDMTVMLSGTKYPTSSIVLPSFKTMLSKTKKATQNAESSMAKSLGRDIYASLKFRWKKNVAIAAWYLASILDP